MGENACAIAQAGSQSCSGLQARIDESCIGRESTGKMPPVMRARVAVVFAGMIVAAGAGAAAADEPKPAMSASFIMTIVAAPVDVTKNAYDAGLKDPSPVASRTDATSGGEVLPDGSVRYGRTVITVKNPCPPGEHVELPPPRLGRR